MNILKHYSLLWLLILLTIPTASAEDIELYLGDRDNKNSKRPQVLIIFDTSGSMTTTEQVVPEAYDPNVAYQPIANEPLDGQEYIYYSNRGVPSINTSRRFLKTNNSCEVSKQALGNVGFYNGVVKYYRKPRFSYTYGLLPGEWRDLSNTNNGTSRDIIDCKDDLEKAININASHIGNGFPSSLPSLLNDHQNKPYPYEDLAIDQVTQANFSQGSGVTLYSRNYLRWYYQVGAVQKTRIAIAQETVNNLVQAAPGIDFGLMVFSGQEGGRVVFDISDLSGGKETDYVNMVNSLTANGVTPLCETLHEAMRYYGGMTPIYGHRSGTPQSILRIEERDANGNIISTELVDRYTTPYKNCSNTIYTIMITDGRPYNDTSSNAALAALDGLDSSKTMWIDTGNQHTSYLPALADYMYNNDINPDLPGRQQSILYTIGFGDDAVNNAGRLLTAAATNGGGKYFPARDATSLLSSLQSALLEVLAIDTSFSSPAVSANNFDRTETLDSIYYAMFLPNITPRWRGNLKKLKLNEGTIVDRNGIDAIDSNGEINAGAYTFWGTSDVADGEKVGAGGVVEMFQTITSRKVYTDTAENGGLELLTADNLNQALNDGGLQEALNDAGFEVALYDSGGYELESTSSVDDSNSESAQQEVTANLMRWAIGIDIRDVDDDGDTTDIREDVFGDPLHSKPLVINYGGTEDNQDIRILLGTNAGAFHMFQDNGDSVAETWAFMPKEFFPNYQTLLDNTLNDDKVYGVDGSATVYRYDENGDGTISGNDKVWVFFGLRRGGTAYYALDVSNPDIPQLMWRIDDNSPGMGELAQSWAKAKVAYSLLNIDDNGVAKPVLFISGGYDTNKDLSGVGSADSRGRAVFMLDAKTGNLLWSASPESNDVGKWTELWGISDSIAADTAIMDSDSDGYVDRLYAADTGGNIWRIDMPGANPSDDKAPWTAFKFASLGGTTEATDRRFFYEPSIARGVFTYTKTTKYNNEDIITRQERPYDVLLIGSGDRTRPRTSVTENRLYMLKDDNILTKSMPNNEIPFAITESNLMDYTVSPYDSATTSDAIDSVDLDVSSKSGWYIDLTGSAEKSLSMAVAVSGIGYFTSFTPPSVDETVANQCALEMGEGKLYAIDLNTGQGVYDWRSLSLGERIPDAPTVVIPPIGSVTNKAPKIRFVGVGKGDGEGTLTLCNAEDCDQTEGVSLKTMRTYLYVEE
ncbi:pilus assembly protein [Thalassotalea maritima]|uniref:pilus assembly protein n=1 Tax=Thalassotalea maritima TaxID=3242416 RepID=UPI0035298277